ncbi:Eukaryotic peptide chain release factor subunit 1-2 [Acorus gramineus]|uniref:Eukaryotic peptide chain release factor subunit 1-2 n=1 Tax=Acorus gramineus TaxID=55184 RepID=A0AAV9AHI3_ACOGR|nr:Eukaryotic peptide chain release factor subunit 1-2 [Acorus gramineus]
MTDAHETDKNIQIWKMKKLIKALDSARENDGKERKVTFDFKPFKAMDASLYLCDNKFRTSILKP